MFSVPRQGDCAERRRIRASATDLDDSAFARALAGRSVATVEKVTALGPTFGVSNALAYSAIGLALLVRTRRVRVERERFLFA